LSEHSGLRLNGCHPFKLGMEYACCPCERLYFRVSDIPAILKVIMSTIPACPQCSMENTYPDGDNYVCADCSHDWAMVEAAHVDDNARAVVKDANGNVLVDGDSVVLIKDLKVKGSSITLKVGSKVKSIRLVGGDHEVDCKMDVGNFMLKACYLKKV
jgi:protein PhnA